MWIYNEKGSRLKIHAGSKHKNKAYLNYIFKRKSNVSCSKIVNTRTDSCISVVHTCTCWSYYSPCCKLPEPPADDSPIVDVAGLLYLPNSLVIQDKNINWSLMYEKILEFGLEDWYMSTLYVNYEVEIPYVERTSENIDVMHLIVYYINKSIIKFIKCTTFANLLTIIWHFFHKTSYIINNLNYIFISKNA